MDGRQVAFERVFRPSRDYRISDQSSSTEGAVAQIKEGRPFCRPGLPPLDSSGIFVASTSASSVARRQKCRRFLDNSRERAGQNRLATEHPIFPRSHEARLRLN